MYWLQNVMDTKLVTKHVMASKCIGHKHKMYQPQNIPAVGTKMYHDKNVSPLNESNKRWYICIDHKTYQYEPTTKHIDHKTYCMYVVRLG